MIQAAGSSIAVLVGATFFVAGLRHAAAPTNLTRALTDSMAWPKALVVGATGVAIAAEVSVGGALLMATLFGLGPAATSYAATGALGLSALYLSYVVHLHLRPGSYSCGCDSSGTPVTGTTVFRNLSLTAAAGLTMATTGGSGGATSTVEWLMVLFPGLALAVILWLLPAAMTNLVRN